MKKTGHTTILQQTFDYLDEKSLNALRAVSKRCTYPRGTVLCNQGKLEDTFYIIVEGMVATTQKTEDDKARLIGTVGANQYFGELGLLDDSPRLFTCTTMTETTVLEITDEMFDMLVEESPAVAYHITKQILATMRRMDELAIGDLRAKNQALERAYAELKVAQDELVEKERLERELELAADLQRSLLPDRFPAPPGYRVAGHLKPARKVGGDLYGVIALDAKHLGLLLADVADKGVHAAMFMAVTQTLFYMEARRSLSPAAVATAVHQGMMELAHTLEIFVTAFYGVLHIPSGKLTYVRAGQEPPLLMRPGKPSRFLTGEGRFLGLWPELKLKEYTVKLKSGDRMVAYSDGVTDAVNPADERFGIDRLSRSLETYGSLPAADLIHAIVADVDGWQQEAAPFDDLTLLVLEAS